MEKLNAFAEKIKKTTDSFESSVEDIFKTFEVHKKCSKVELKVSIFYEKVLEVNHNLFEMKCVVLQMRHDLYTMKEEAKSEKNKIKDADKNKKILELHNAEEVYDDLKDLIIKVLEGLLEKIKKRKFCIDEIESYQQMLSFLTTIKNRII